jgi:predicted O-methyltransferase YrrM
MAERRSTDVLRRELRYLVDLVIRDGVEPPPEKGNPLAAYARERHVKQHRMVEFARALEASRIRELYLSEIFPEIGKVAIPIGAIHEQTFHPNKVDLLYVSAIARHRKAERIFEFGTYQGRTTYHLTFAAEPGAQVTTLNLAPDDDPLCGPYIGSFFRGSDRERFITQLYGDSRELDAKEYEGQFDLIFVDGDHSYEVVASDTKKAFRMLKPGGAILWHDYAPKSPDLVRFFARFTRRRPLFRIRRTCLLLHLDGVDPLAFEALEIPPSLEREKLDSEPFFIEELYHA